MTSDSTRYVLVFPNPEFNPNKPEGFQSLFWLKDYFNSEDDLNKRLNEFNPSPINLVEYDASRELAIEGMREALSVSWPGEYGKTVMEFNSKYLAAFEKASK